MSLSSETPGKKGSAPGALKEALGLFLILLIPFLPYLATVCKLSYLAYNNSSDTFLYLNIARNFLCGRGLVSSFNVYQYWTGLYYPALPFVHVVYSLFLSVLYFFFPSIQKLIFFNFILAFLNSYLIYRILKKIYHDRAIATWVACLVAAMVSTEITLLRLFTEQLSLLVTLSAVLFFVSKRELSRRDLAFIGLLCGIGFLVRSSAIIYPLCFFFALMLAKKDGLIRRTQPFLLLFWPLFIAGVYGGFIFVRYGVFFPEYPGAFKNYYLATFTTGGAFFSQTPALRFFSGNFSGSYFGINFLNMSKVLFCEAHILILFGLIRMVRLFRQRQKDELLLCGLVLLPIAGTILIYPYMRVAEFQWTRFLLLPVIFLSALGVKAWRDFTQKFFPRTKKFLFHAVLVIVFASNFYQSCRVLEVYWRKNGQDAKVAAMRALSQWTAQNTKNEDLIAVSLYLIGRVDFDRPTVILPLYKMLTRNNLEKFLALYRPRALIFEKTLPEALREDLKKNGYDQSPSFGADSSFVILEPVWKSP